tara:strand:+ start:17911 stop:20235 length:2325 start_codon:yes stop_codon:yes gene_type:complete
MPNNKENESKRIGDTLFTAESHVVVAEATSTHYREVIEGRTQADIPDLLRHLNGSFWCLNEDSIQQLFKNRFTTDGSQINATLLATRTSASTGSGLQPGETAQDFRISFNGENEEADWKEALKSWRDDSSRENIVFEDHTTTIDMYEEGSNLQEESAGVKNHFAEIKSDYNFLETRYEKVLGELLPEEKALPNFYGFVLKNQNSDSWKNLIRLGDRIQVPESERLDNEQSNFKPVSRYYNAWAKNFGDYVEDPDYTENIEKTKVIRFTKTEMESLSDLYKYKELFPFFVTTEFTTENDSALGSILEKTNFSREISNYINAENRDRKSCVQVISSLNETTGEFSKNQIITQNKNFYDIQELFDNYVPGEYATDSLSFREEKEGEEYKAYYTLMSLIARGKIEKISKRVTRTYDEILNGTTAYNEVIYYMLRKYDDQGNHLQSFTFPNTDKVDVIRFVDTQINYDKRYRYTLSSRNIIFGTKYEVLRGRAYSNSSDIGITIKSSPSIKLVEFRLFDKSCIVRDNPPIAPEITMVPFKGISEKIRILLNSAVGRNMLKPVIFTKEEERAVESYKIAQDIPLENEKILFETDDSVEKFLIYKMDKEPADYMDFYRNGEIIEVSTSIGRVKASSASYDDKILPNNKYYYFARCQDYHGNLSYPTTVFEVEMKADSGSIYPVIKEYEFKEPDTRQPSVGVKRFIRVKASIPNLMADTEAMGLNNSDVEGPEPGEHVYLGITDDVVWNKKFKIRVTSKSTGRKIDYNFTMKTKTPVRIEDL